MSWSLGESRALAVKAVRGAGLNWGLAEDASQATVQLESAGLPGIELLSEGLATKTEDGFHPKWLLQGVELVDANHRPPVKIAKMDEPLLLATFLMFGSATNKTLLKSASCEILIGSNSLQLDLSSYRQRNKSEEWFWELADPAYNNPTFADFELGTQSRTPDERADSMRTLERFAANTYAPDTEESRLKGAGSELSDND